MNNRSPFCFVLCVWLAVSQVVATAGTGQGDGSHSANHETGRNTRREAAKRDPIADAASGRQINVGSETKVLPDLMLLDQDGRKVRFYSDLIKDKTVLISFFYTSCTYTCLIQGGVFSRLQTELGDRLGKEVFLISVTTDPETDTPQRLSTWGARRHLKKGWTLVTGGKDDMRKLVGHLTGNPLGRIELHAPFIYIGNDKRNRWEVTYGLAEPKELIKRIEEMRR